MVPHNEYVIESLKHEVVRENEHLQNFIFICVFTCGTQDEMVRYSNGPTVQYLNEMSFKYWTI